MAARNILTFTLLPDDTKGQQQSHIWQIYYHVYLDDKALKLLQSQAKKLSDLATTLESWKDGKYGKIMTFCDEGTFTMVKKLWEEYGRCDRTKSEQTKYDNDFKAGIEDALGKKKDLGGAGLNLTAPRSAAPTSSTAIQDIPKAHDYYWKHGKTDRNPSKLPKDRRPNPTFVSQDTDTFTLHYGTDPHLGFPLATAYVPLAKDSPLTSENGVRSDFHRMTDAAQSHFRAWGNVFRRSAKNLTLRFFVGDAIAFCHTLQHVKAAGIHDSHWYRNKYTVQIIELDRDDYSSGGLSPTLLSWSRSWFPLG